VNLDKERTSTAFKMCWHFELLLNVLAQITKKGEIEREMCPWAISINVLVIRCPTHIVFRVMCTKC
jgi:hypothetical protein